jgi:hypothetical protein
MLDPSESESLNLKWPLPRESERAVDRVIDVRRFVIGDMVYPDKRRKSLASSESTALSTSTV